MLIEFRVGNYRSFLSEQTLSYLPSADQAHERTHCIRTGIKAAPRVSRAALVFGPNAGGKSNLILALATFRDLVLNSTSFSEGQFAERYTPFRFDAAHDRPTEFIIDLLLNQVRYRYVISYDARRIISERLLVYRTGKSQRWFQRNYDASKRIETWAPFSPSFSGPREMWRKATRPQALFLTTAAQLNSELLRPLLHWFEVGLEIVFPRDVADVSRLASYTENSRFKARMLSVVRSADIPIDDFRISERDRSVAGAAGPGSATSRVDPTIEFLHSQRSKNPVWLDSAFEAAGTNRLLVMLGPILCSIDKGKLLAIDEFDTSLHPRLARLLIQLIHYSGASERTAQLLLTSHNSTLMDLEILRRDQIWLIELDNAHASQLSPLLRQSPRKHEMIGRAYLRGRYGAVPDIRTESLAETVSIFEAQARPKARRIG